MAFYLYRKDYTNRGSRFFHFEELLPSNNTEYDILYEFEPGTSTSVSRVLQWSSGNPGFKLTSMAGGRTGYPTQQITDGYRGKGLKLTTCDTGSFGAMVKMYIAAGNLFIGSFDLANALKDPLRATKFGIQYYKRPVSLKGYYKFKAGEVYTDEASSRKTKKTVSIFMPYYMKLMITLSCWMAVIA